MKRVIAALIVVAGCGHHRHQVLQPHEAFKVDAFTVPRADTRRELAACKPGVALVPHGGGVVVAGWNKWVVEPSGSPITSVACDELGDLFLVRGGGLTMQGPSGTATVALPAGDWQVVGTPVASVWLYGKLADKRSAILHYDPEAGLGSVYVGPEPIRTLAALDTTGVVAVLDRELVAWHGDSTVSLGTLDDQIDGLAVGDDGTLFVSGPAGIVRLHSIAEPPVRIVSGIHGPLRLRGDRLYVLWRDGSTVLRIVPQPEHIETTTITLPPEHVSIFREGPASDRRSSLDVNIGYTQMTQQGPMTIVDDNPVVVSKATLGQAITFQGVDLGVNFGSAISRHVFLGAELVMAGGSAPLVGTVTDGTHPGSAATTSDVLYLGGRFPVGIRIPFGWFSLTGGSGIELARISANTWSEPVLVGPAFNFGTSETASWLPVWGRFEVELWCVAGLWVQGGYSSGISNTPDYSSFTAGFTLRALRTCN